jgi:hypothetical protein
MSEPSNTAHPPLLVDFVLLVFFSSSARRRARDADDAPDRSISLSLFSSSRALHTHILDDTHFACVCLLPVYPVKAFGFLERDDEPFDGEREREDGGGRKPPQSKGLGSDALNLAPYTHTTPTPKQPHPPRAPLKRERAAKQPTTKEKETPPTKHSTPTGERESNSDRLFIISRVARLPDVERAPVQLLPPPPRAFAVWLACVRGSTERESAEERGGEERGESTAPRCSGHPRPFSRPSAPRLAPSAARQDAGRP